MRTPLLVLSFALLTGCSTTVKKAESPKEATETAVTTSEPRVSHLPSYMQAPGEMEMDWQPTERPKPKAVQPLKSRSKPYFVSKKRTGSLFVLPSN